MTDVSILCNFYIDVEMNGFECNRATIYVLYKGLIKDFMENIKYMCLM